MAGLSRRARVRLRSVDPRRALPLLRRLGRRRGPWLVSWMLTERCNYRCALCGCWSSDSAELSPNQARSYADEMIGGGVLAVSFCGGEVLLRDDLGALLRRLRRAGVTTRVTSNGQLVPARIEQLRHASGLKLSLDGPADLHDRIRGAGAHRAVADAVAAARAAGIPTQLNTVLSRELVERIDEHLGDVDRFGASVTFQPPERRAGAEPDAAGAAFPDPAAFAMAVRRLQQLRAGGDRRIANSPGTLARLAGWPSQEPIDCHAGSRFCRILADGRVVACDRPQAPHPPQVDVPAGFAAGVARLRHAGTCPGCWRNNTMEINRLLGGAPDAWTAVRRWL